MSRTTIEVCPVMLAGVKAGLWRGTIERVEYKSDIYGPYRSAERIWRCHHEHYSPEAARACATRELRKSPDHMNRSGR